VRVPTDRVEPTHHIPYRSELQQSRLQKCASAYAYTEGAPLTAYATRNPLRTVVRPPTTSPAGRRLAGHHHRVRRSRHTRARRNDGTGADRRVSDSCGDVGGGPRCPGKNRNPVGERASRWRGERSAGIGDSVFPPSRKRPATGVARTDTARVEGSAFPPVRSGGERAPGVLHTTRVRPTRPFLVRPWSRFRAECPSGGRTEHSHPPTLTRG
jgi:hypothetical protein